MQNIITHIIQRQHNKILNMLKPNCKWYSGERRKTMNEYTTYHSTVKENKTKQERFELTRLSLTNTKQKGKKRIQLLLRHVMLLLYRYSQLVSTKQIQ